MHRVNSIVARKIALAYKKTEQTTMTGLTHAVLSLPCQSEMQTKINSIETLISIKFILVEICIPRCTTIVCSLKYEVRCCCGFILSAYQFEAIIFLLYGILQYYIYNIVEKSYFCTLRD